MMRHFAAKRRERAGGAKLGEADLLSLRPSAHRSVYGEVRH
jgi:hypothetical protein